MRRVVVGILAVGLFCAFCYGVYVFEDGYNLPNKPCRPIGYPTGERLERGDSTNWVPQKTYTTTDSLATVLTFYDQRLSVKSFPSERGQWQRESLSSTYLYSCYSADVNDYTTETGCIYVEPHEMQTVVDIRLYRGGGSFVQCPRNVP